MPLLKICLLFRSVVVLQISLAFSPLKWEQKPITNAQLMKPMMIFHGAPQRLEKMVAMLQETGDIVLAKMEFVVNQVKSKLQLFRNDQCINQGINILG